MYVNHRTQQRCQEPFFKRAIISHGRKRFLTPLVVATVFLSGFAAALAQELQSSSLIRKVGEMGDKMELTTNSSRILTLDKNIPRVQVNNPELIAVTPLSATQVQISAKKAGVTQVNLWDSDGKVHSIDVMIYGDARELENALRTQFPHASIKVYRYSESLVLTGFIDRPDHVSPIMQLAADYSPKVINNVQVGGVQQVLLKVKVMEVSRPKLRQLGMDWAWFGGGNGSFVVSRPGELISTFSSAAQTVTTPNNATAAFGVIGNSGAFFGALDLLEQNQVAKILADPNIVAVSGRPAQFIVGGETPILVPQSLGTTSIEYKAFGTQIDFLPIVLGNGNIRLEVRPQVSFLDRAAGITLNSIEVPGFSVRRVDTAVEMQAGQTFALAGLVQEKSNTINRGLPYLKDLPVVGVPFRRMREEVEEVELLIVVTPEFVDPIDGCDMPCGGPGYATTTPTRKQLYCGGHVEVPTYMNPTSGLTSCGQDPCARCTNGCNGGCNASCNGGACGCNGNGALLNGDMPMQGMPPQGEAMPGGVSIPAGQMPGGTGYDEPTSSVNSGPMPTVSEQAPTVSTTISDSPTAPASSPAPAPNDLFLPGSNVKSRGEAKSAAQPPLPPQPTPPAPSAPALPKPAPAQALPPVPPPAHGADLTVPPAGETSYVLPFTDSTGSPATYNN